MASELDVAEVIRTLQEALSRSQEREQALQEELARVKQDNLRLAEANLKLQAELSRLQAAPLVKSYTLPPRPIADNAPLSKVNNQNIGWFD